MRKVFLSISRRITSAFRAWVAGVEPRGTSGEPADLQVLGARGSCYSPLDPSHPNRTAIDRLIFAALLLLVTFTMTSCAKKPSQGGSGQEALPVELTFRDQVKAVKEGRSTKIYVRQETIDDAHLGQLKGLDNLEVLNLPNSSMTDQGLAKLGDHPKLMQLRLSGPLVTDAGLKEIAKLKSLRFLHLIDVPITDAGLEHLQGMTWLESFYLDGGKATDEGIEQLLKALPGLHFHKDQHHLPSDPNKHQHD